MTLVNADTGEIVAAPFADATLEECEVVIERGLAIFVDVGNALIAIREGHKYRKTHDTFEAYCAGRWRLSRARAYQLIEGAEVVASLSTMVDIPLPATERQARALSPLKAEPARMADAMQRAGTTPTAARIADAVKTIVREAVAKVESRAEDRAALADLNRAAEKAGLDMDEDRQATRGAFARLCRDLAALPAPAAFFAHQRDYLRPRHRIGAQAAHDWLSELLAGWEDQ